MSNLGKIIVLLPFLFACAFARFSSLNHVEEGKPIDVHAGYGGITTRKGGNGSENQDYESDPYYDKKPVNGDEKDEEGNNNWPRGEHRFPFLFPFPFSFPWFGNHKEPRKEAKEPAAVTKNESKPDFETNFLGSWKVDNPNSGVSAMHVQLLPNNKAVWYDTVNLGRSDILADPPACRRLVGGRRGDKGLDCTAHAIEYDVETAQVRTMKMEYDPWCSSGGMSPDGALVSTGGNQEGFRTLRIFNPFRNFEFQEKPGALSANRWYATQILLENGSFVVVGGRAAHNYEIIPSDKLNFPIQQFGLPLLEETQHEKENNLYPFVNLLPDGNIFVFANYKSIILNPYTGETIRSLPDLAGGSRNYPASGMSTLLPINLNVENPENVDVEVIVCGGNTADAFKFSEFPPRKFFPAFKDCGRLSLTKQGAQWEKEDMPSPRTMGDSLLLPTGDILIINGAQAGTSAWDAAEAPNFKPVLYRPNKKKGERFKELTPTNIPRMYHSTSAILPDGQILIAGSNTNEYYKFNKKDNPEMIYPTELTVEKFSPPYLAPELQQYRPQILEVLSDKNLEYGREFIVQIRLYAQIDQSDIKVTMYSPPFTTHGYSQNQRLLILGLKQVTNQQITVVAPPSGKLAPPGYYLLFVVHRGVPSRGMWVHIK
ncbi:aldehyde oxidase GLOX1-like [Olea europaea var. sylvestris]|uniref:aldehyde oxidase GLOX1-like n=1 Tax=Olea europaea var. sylvestris TaxID=158386 RepID=UPI000C1D08BF|nr:aldehyde oxidase GLOX1-like [Olea europaea var. sylvestris]